MTAMRSEASKQRQRDSKRKEYWWYREHGICVYCHQTDAVPGMQACADCIYKRQIRRIAQSSPQDRAKRAEYNRKWRIEHKAAGLCSECNQPAIDGLTRCRKHKILHNTSTAFRKVHTVPDLTKCSIVECGESALPGKRFCRCHYQMKCDVVTANQPNSNVNHIWRRLDGAMFGGRRKRHNAGGKEGHQRQE